MFLRVSECLNLTPDDFRIEDNELVIHIVCRKTDQVGKGKNVFVCEIET